VLSKSDSWIKNWLINIGGRRRYEGSKIQQAKAPLIVQ
jgi:hypothetical protein